jgi:hypothetical protein
MAANIRSGKTFAQGLIQEVETLLEHIAWYEGKRVSIFEHEERWKVKNPGATLRTQKTLSSLHIRPHKRNVAERALRTRASHARRPMFISWKEMCIDTSFCDPWGWPRFLTFHLWLSTFPHASMS